MELDSVHLGILLVTALGIVTADHHAFQYMRGTRATLSRSFVTWTHRTVWAGLIGMIVTGVLLALPMWEYLRSEPAFYVKMGFVLTLIVNSFFIGALSRVATERPWSVLTNDERRTMYVSGTFSALGWVGSAVIGLFFL